MEKLNLNSMTLEQKIGQLICVRFFHDEEDKRYVFDMLHKGAVGGIQVRYENESTLALIKDIQNAANYPVLICADMETGFPGSKLKIPFQMAIGSTGEEELAYEAARATAIEAKNAGYSVVWGPIVDLAAEGALCKICRCFSDRVEDTIKYGSAMVRGYQDEGMVVTAKHFPGGSDVLTDSHMCPSVSAMDEEALLEKDLQPYIEAMKNSDLSGIMTSHNIFTKIDGDIVGTLSPRIINMIRKQGFDGIIMSDSLAMMAIEKNMVKENVLVWLLQQVWIWFFRGLV